MNIEIFITLTVLILATMVCERKRVRIAVSVVLISLLGVWTFFRNLSQYYERGYIAASVVSLAERVPEEERKEIIEAAEEFKRTYRTERVVESHSGIELWVAINRQNHENKKKANKSEMATSRKPSD